MSNSLGTSWTVAFQGPVSLVFPSKTTGVGCHFSLRVNFSIRGSDPHYPHWQANFLPLSCQGNPSIGNTAVKKQTKNEISFSRQTVHVIISKLCQCDFQVVLIVKNLPVKVEDRRHGFDPWVGKNPWRRKWQPTPIFLPGKFHGQRSLVGYSPWGPKESDWTEHPHRRHRICIQ